MIFKRRVTYSARFGKNAKQRRRESNSTARTADKLDGSCMKNRILTDQIFIFAKNNSAVMFTNGADGFIKDSRRSVLIRSDSGNLVRVTLSPAPEAIG